MTNHISKKVTCSEPYKQVHFDSRVNFGPCCQYIGPRENFSSITEYLDSNWLLNLKNELNDRKKINGCNFCWRQEEQNVTSMRQDRNNFYKNEELNKMSIFLKHLFQGLLVYIYLLLLLQSQSRICHSSKEIWGVV